MHQPTDAPTLLVPAAVPSATASHPPEDVATPWTAVSDAAKKNPGGASTASDLPPAYIPGPPMPKGDDHNSMSATGSQVGRAEPPALMPAKLPGTSKGDSPIFAATKHGLVPESGQSPAYGKSGQSPSSSVPGNSSHSRAIAAGGRSADRADGYTAAPPSTFAAMPGPATGSTRSNETSSYNRAGSYHALQPAASDIAPPGVSDSPRSGSVSPYGTGSSYPTYSSASDGNLPRATENYNSARGTYKIQPNDNYWVISEKIYGSGAYFNALAEVNRSKVAQRDKLRVGDTISTPTIAQLEQAYPQLCPKPSHRDTVRSRSSLVSAHSPYAGGRTYEVQEGDTLFDIARHELGKGSRWAEIYDLNRDALGKDFDYLTPGMQLVLPPKTRLPRPTGRPGGPPRLSIAEGSRSQRRFSRTKKACAGALSRGVGTR